MIVFHCMFYWSRDLNYLGDYTGTDSTTSIRGVELPQYYFENEKLEFTKGRCSISTISVGQWRNR